MLAPGAPARLHANGRAFSHIAQFVPELTALRRERACTRATRCQRLSA